LGEIYLNRGETDQALHWLYKALEGDPARKPTHALLADYFEKAGNTDRAKKHREMAEGKVRREMGQ
jgi:Tfp pilus assembly protein PilF